MPTQATLTKLISINLFKSSKVVYLQDPIINIAKNIKQNRFEKNKSKYILAVGRLTRQKIIITQSRN